MPPLDFEYICIVRSDVVIITRSRSELRVAIVKIFLPSSKHNATGGGARRKSINSLAVWRRFVEPFSLRNITRRLKHFTSKLAHHKLSNLLKFTQNVSSFSLLGRLSKLTRIFMYHLEQQLRQR